MSRFAAMILSVLCSLGLVSVAQSSDRPNVLAPL